MMAARHPILALLSLALFLLATACSFHVHGQASTSHDAKSKGSSSSQSGSASARGSAQSKGDSKSKVQEKSSVKVSAKASGKAKAKGDASARGKTSKKTRAHGKSKTKGRLKFTFKSKGRAKGMARSKRNDSFRAGVLIKGRGKASGSVSGKAKAKAKAKSDKKKVAKKPAKKDDDKKVVKKPKKPAKKDDDKKVVKKPKKPSPEEPAVVDAEPIDPPEEEPDNVFGYETPVRGCFEGIVYPLRAHTKHLPTAWGALEALSAVYACEWDIPVRDWSQGFPGVDDLFEWFAIRYSGHFAVETAGKWKFRISSDDGAKLYIDGKLVINNDGEHPPKVAEGEIELLRGEHEMVLEYFQGPRYHINLQLFATPPGGNEGIFSVR